MNLRGSVIEERSHSAGRFVLRNVVILTFQIESHNLGLASYPNTNYLVPKPFRTKTITYVRERAQTTGNLLGQFQLHFAMNDISSEIFCNFNILFVFLGNNTAFKMCTPVTASAPWQVPIPFIISFSSNVDIPLSGDFRCFASEDILCFP
jgi:hypothetical protein